MENRNQHPQQSERPRISDQQAIDMQFGGFKGWLQDNGIPTPTTAEFRLMLYTNLYQDFRDQVKKNQDGFLEQVRQQIPHVQQALKEYQEKHYPQPQAEAPKEVVVPEVMDDGNGQ